MQPLHLTTEMLVARKAPGVSTLFWTYFAVVVGASVAGHYLFPQERHDLVVFLQTVALFITTCIFAGLHWPSLAVQFKRFGFHRPAALVGLLALIPLLAINYLLALWVSHEVGPEVDSYQDLGLSRGTLIFLICVLPALVEEIAFRGLVQHWLMTALTPRRALIITAALFTVLHFTVLYAPYIFVVGLLLGWTRWKTGSLYPSMLIHFLHNLVVVEFISV